MAFNDLEKQRAVNEAMAFIEKRRPPPHIRPQLDIVFRLKGQSVVIVETRPIYSEPERKHDIPVAKATYVRTRDVWRIYCMSADLKWHGYTPLAEVGSLSSFLDEVDADPYACFWG